MLTEADIREALRACYTSCLGRSINIVDLGLLESIALVPDPEAPGAGIPGVPPKFRLTLTLIASTPDTSTPDACTPDPDALIQLSAQIQNRLAGLPTLTSTTIRFADSPIWTRDRITPQGRALLKLDAVHFPILNNR